MLMDHLRKTRKENKKLKESGNSKYIYQNELDRACFQHNMTYGDFKEERLLIKYYTIKYLILLKD